MVYTTQSHGKIGDGGSYDYNICTNIKHVFLTHGLGHTNCTDPVVHRPAWQAQIVSLDEFAMPSEAESGLSACRPRMLSVSCTVASLLPQ